MKKINIAKKTWVISIFLILITILIAVIDYKVHYQYLSKTKLYFYECSGNLCITEVEDDSKLLYSAYECEYEKCPIYKKELDDTYVLLENKNELLLYNYRTSKIISKDYDDYKFLDSKNIIVTRNQKQGMIDTENKLLIETNYDQLGYEQNGYITGYNLNHIIAKKDNKFGIISLKTGEITEPFNYEETNIEELLKIIKDNMG